MAKKKSNHGGARQGAGSLPRLDKVGNVLQLSRLDLEGNADTTFAQPDFLVVKKGRGYAILENSSGALFKLEIVKED